LYTTNNPKTEGENTDFFDVIKKYENVKLIIYKKSQKTYDFLLTEADKNGIKYATAEYLSLALVQVKKELKAGDENNVLILCNSMKQFDKHIVFLDRI
jgi:hypothetical protein